jgi:hypothetical protein
MRAARGGEAALDCASVKIDLDAAKGIDHTISTEEQFQLATGGGRS